MGEDLGVDFVGEVDVEMRFGRRRVRMGESHEFLNSELVNECLRMMMKNRYLKEECQGC